MATEISDFPVSQHRILRRFSSLMFELDFEYQNSKPQYGENGFRERVDERIRMLVFDRHDTTILPNGDVNEDEIVAVIAEDEVEIESDVAWIYLACANAMASMRALEAGDLELAWSLQCRAHFYLGMLKATNRAAKVFTKTVLEIDVKERSSKGGFGRNAPTRKMKERVYEMLRSEGVWPSQGKAVIAAENFLKAEYGDKALADFEKTITGWVKKMPDRFVLIPSLAIRLDRTK